MALPVRPRATLRQMRVAPPASPREAKKGATMSFEEDLAKVDDVPNDVVDLMAILPVEPEGYEQEAVYAADGVPSYCSGAFWDDEDAPEGDGLVPIGQLIPVEEEQPCQLDWRPVGEEEEARRRTQELINDAYARADTAWSDEEAEEILWSSLPPGAGLMDGGWI